MIVVAHRDLKDQSKQEIIFPWVFKLCVSFLAKKKI